MGGDAQCSADSAMWHKTGETASEKGCEWVAMFPEKRCLVKGCMDMGQEGSEGTDCPAEKYTACDGCMTTCAGQMVCGGTGDDGKKPAAGAARSSTTTPLSHVSPLART